MTRDVLLHCLGAAAIAVAGLLLGWLAFSAPVVGAWAGAVASAAFWPLREAWQAGWTGPGEWSANKRLEAFAPLPVGFALAVAATLIL